MILTEQKFLDDLNAGRRNQVKNTEYIFAILAVAWGFDLICFLVTVGWSDEGVPWMVIFLGGLIVLNVLVSIFVHFRNRKLMKHPDIRVEEDYVIDKDWYLPNRSILKTYTLLLMSGSEFTSAERFDDFQTPLEPIFVAKLYDRNKVVGRKIYRQNYWALDPGMKMTEGDLPSSEDLSALALRISQLYSDGYTDSHGEIHKIPHQSLKEIRCPECGKLLPGKPVAERTCRRCGARYQVKIRDLMNEEDWYDNELGEMPVLSK